MGNADVVVPEKYFTTNYKSSTAGLKNNGGGRATTPPL